MSFNTTGTINEVLIGTGVLYIKDRSTASLAFPSDDGSNAWEDPTGLTVPWDEVGYSEDGWTLEVDKTFEDVMVAEELDPIKSLKSAQEVRLTGEMAQASLDNLAVALGGGSVAEDSVNYATGYYKYVPPVTDQFTEYALVLHTDGKAGSDRQFHIPRAVNVGSFSMAHQKAPQKVTLATEFKLLVPDSFNVGADSAGNNYLFIVVENRNDSDELDIN